VWQAGERTLNEGENTLWNPLILCNFGFHGGGGGQTGGPASFPFGSKYTFLYICFFIC